MSSPDEQVNRIGEKIRVLRDRYNISTRALGDAAGVSNAYITQIEHGKRRPSIDVVVRIARYFDVTTDQLMRDELEV